MPVRKPLLVLVLIGLSACTLGPDYERPDIDLPESAYDSTLLSASQQNAIAYWWTRYRDPDLNQLIDDALDDNLDIALQAARFQEARAQLGLANANLFPSIEGHADAARKKSSGAIPSPATGQTGTSSRSNSFSVAASLSYELDVFGGLRRADEQARALLLSSAYTRDSVRLSVVSDVVSNYISLLATERQIRITRETIKTREQGLYLDRERYKYGTINQLKLLQTQSLLETARGQLPPLKQQASDLRSSLAILAGRTPRQIMADRQIEAGTFDNVHLPQALPDVMPSQLVDRRPDIRAAEASLIAANANIGVVKADFFPKFNLKAMIGTDALAVGDLFEPFSQTQRIAGTITAPILDFGRREARYETAIAQRDAAEIQYRQTLRQAFREVRDALVAVELTNERLASLRRQIADYRKTVDLARSRYKVGRTAYFDVLDAQRQLFSSQLDLADAIRDRYTATADLFKALGGGWTENSDSLTPGLEAARERYAPSENNDAAARSRNHDAPAVQQSSS